MLVLKDTKKIPTRESIRSIEKGQVDQEATTGHRGATLLNQPAACLDGATGCQQVVDDQHTLTGLNAIFVNFQAVGAVFQFVFQRMSSKWQFSWLAYWYERGVQTHGQGDRKNETKCFGGRDDIDLLVLVFVSKTVNALGESSL